MNGVELGQKLFDKLDQAIQIKSVDDPAWHGLPNKCHENVERWIALHPEDRPIRGYLIVSATDFSALFDLHSIVRKDGSLVDVTPLAYPCRFIQFDMSNNQFEVCKRHFNQIPHVTWDASDLRMLPSIEDEGQF
jgi:hypothetical protein